MAFVEFIPPEQASQQTRDMYDRQAGFFGYLPNYATVFGLRPEIMSLWAHLQAGIKAHMPARRFELIALAAAHELRNSYCCLAHSKKLMTTFTVAEIRDIVLRGGAGVLSKAEMAVVRHARLVARHADRVTATDIARLRDVGLDDGEIFDITAAAAARAFFTKLVDGLGAEPDAVYAELDPQLLETMIVGRDVAAPAPD
jgi:alkylhydroperoxidase family enzyme